MVLRLGVVACVYVCVVRGLDIVDCVMEGGVGDVVCGG